MFDSDDKHTGRIDNLELSLTQDILSADVFHVNVCNRSRYADVKLSARRAPTQCVVSVGFLRCQYTSIRFNTVTVNITLSSHWTLIYCLSQYRIESVLILNSYFDKRLIIILTHNDSETIIVIDLLLFIFHSSFEMANFRHKYTYTYLQPIWDSYNPLNFNYLFMLNVLVHTKLLLQVRWD